MQTVLIVIHLMVVAALVVVVLLQRSEGGALGIGGGGGGGFFTGRGQASALTRATAILATIFFVTSIALTWLAAYNRAPKSILEGSPASSSAPATANPIWKATAAPNRSGATPTQFFGKSTSATPRPCAP